MSKKKSSPDPKPDDVLRRMLNTPPKPHKDKPAPKPEPVITGNREKKTGH